MATSPIYGWAEPDNTDLVKNGALAIRTLGNAIDTTMGTMVAKTIIDAKGDLIAGSAADTALRLAVGSNGETLIADSSAATGLRYQPVNNGNPVINGAFDIAQRGTSIAAPASANTSTLDRFQLNVGANGASTVSQQAVGDTTNLPTIRYCARVQRNSGQTGTTEMFFATSMETSQSIPYAGQAVTVSFYARKGADYSSASSALKVTLRSGTGTDQNVYGYTGGASPINGETKTLTSTWQRFQATGTVSASATELAVYFHYTPVGTASTNDYFEVTGVQLELGSIATTFKRAGGTIQGELAACQRYYYQNSGQFLTPSAQYLSTLCLLTFKLPVTMRTSPTYTAGTGTIFYNGASQAPTFASNTAGVDSYGLQGTTSAITTGVAQFANLNNDHKFSAEL